MIRSKAPVFPGTVLIWSASLVRTASVPASPAAQKQGSAISTVWVTDTRSTEGKIDVALSRTGGLPEDMSETLCAQDVQIGALRAQMVFRGTASENLCRLAASWQKLEREARYGPLGITRRTVRRVQQSY
jgi:hypothetical protein